MIDQRAHLERLTVYVLWYSAARSKWKAQTAQTGYGRTGAGILDCLEGAAAGPSQRLKSDSEGSLSIMGGGGWWNTETQAPSTRHPPNNSWGAESDHHMAEMTATVPSYNA